MKGAANIALSEKSVLDHQIRKSTTKPITCDESFFTMERCSLPRKLLIRGRSGRLNFLLKHIFSSKYIKCLCILEREVQPSISRVKGFDLDT